MKLIIYALVAFLAGEVVTSAKIGQRFKLEWDKIKLSEALPKQYKMDLPRKRLSMFSVSGRIVGGDVAPVGEYPYHVGIVASFGGWCGGSLISDGFVMTAAHCTYESMYVYAYLGAHNIRDENELENGYQIFVGNIIHHPDWKWDIFENDIALLPIPGKVQLSDRIQPIALPSRSDDRLDLENDRVIATGWGYLYENDTTITPLLRNVIVRVEPAAVCNHFYPRILRATNICTAAGIGKGVCTRDDGGPLTYVRKDGSRFVAGVISFVGPLGCHAGWPTMHTRVSKYLNWISDITGIAIRD